MHFTEFIQIVAPLAFSLLVALFAILKGGSAERWGAVIILANMLVGLLIESMGRSQVAVLVDDAVTAAILLAFSVRYASFWLGAVMLLYAMQFALHAYYFVLERPRDVLHVAINNFLFFSVSLCLAAGTAIAWRRRRRQAAVVAPA